MIRSGPSTILILAAVILVSGCAARSRTQTSVLDLRQGLASYYGPGFHGKTTASGAPFDMHAMVAAHPTYPFGTIVRVTNLTNQRAVDVRVLDRGPAKGPQADGVLIDLSYAAAQALGFIRQGRTRVRLEVLRWGD
jgi:rare lipoprotein A